MVVRQINLDMDILRTFSTGVALGSFAKAAERLGRSPSAISLQLRRLEEQAGAALFQRKGRGLALTDAGELLHGYARRMLALNDEAVLALADSVGLKGWIRFGIPQDFAETELPVLLGRFARAHPGVRIEARVDRGELLLQGIERGDLDLALTWGLASPHCSTIGQRRLSFIAARDFIWPGNEPFPLVAFDPPCAFRTAAIEALERAGLPWRHVFSSPSLSGLWAAVTAGIGVTVRSLDGTPAHLRAIDAVDAGSGRLALPDPGALDLVLHCSVDEPPAPVARFRALVVQALTASPPAALTDR